jgi:allantoate deiminase
VTNVIARETRMTLDVRHRSDEVRMLAVDRLIRAAEETAAGRGLTMTARTLLSQPSVPMDQVLVEQIEEAICQAGCKPHRMVSGAGHDAMILAEKVPAAMVFLRTPGGVSHSPEETVEMDDVAKALEAGSHLLELLAGLPARHRRVKRA